MKKIFVGTSNGGKQKEIRKYADAYGQNVSLEFPDATNELHVDESGSTFEENALLKARAYKRVIDDSSVAFVGDDSGIVIPALNGEPGVFTRRWNGSEMTDEQIVSYCLRRMAGLTEDERRASFITVLAVLHPDGREEYVRGVMSGRILEKPLEGVEPQPGFPFKSIFWVEELDRPIFEVHGMSPEERAGFLTHRENAFSQLFQSI